MRLAYFDCHSGVAGDMILGALLDAGCPPETMHDAISQLKLDDVQLEIERTQRGGMAGTLAKVRIQETHHHRHLPDIQRIIEATALPAAVKTNALAIFQRLAEAEAKAHGIPLEKVHFHEVGAADAIVDIVCACTGLEALGIQQIVCSAIPTGNGTVTCAHGVLPVPAPATAELLRNVPIAASDAQHELTTPTGAAIATTLAQSFGPLPNLTISAVGYGAGTREDPKRPNLLRILIGDSALEQHEEGDVVTILEASLDDTTGQALGYACEQLLNAGALDAYLVPIIMKKGRPGHLLTVLCQPQDADRLEAVIFAETSTLGLRRSESMRARLARSVDTVTTRFGEIRVKVGRHCGRVVQVWPEYEDCAAAARSTTTPLRDVQHEALHIWNKNADDSSG